MLHVKFFVFLDVVGSDKGGAIKKTNDKEKIEMTGQLCDAIVV